jgi:hypothetical protein
MRKTAIRAVRIGETLGAAPRCPTISNSAKALVATHAAGIGERPVQLRLADRSPVAQPAERPTLNREVDGANPSGAAISSLRHAASRAGRSIRRSPHRHCGGRRGRTAPAHHFNNAPVAQCIEHRASNAEVAGEIPAGSTILERNVNRTSVPGFSAKEIDPRRGLGSMPSTFRPGGGEKFSKCP